MMPALERRSLHARNALPTSRAWRLLARLPALIRSRLSTLEPSELPPHLRRDLGFQDHGRPRHDWYDLRTR